MRMVQAGFHCYQVVGDWFGYAGSGGSDGDADTPLFARVFRTLGIMAAAGLGLLVTIIIMFIISSICLL